MVTLSLCITLVYGLISVPSFACAVVAQVLMGTLWVFGAQATDEALAVLSHGSRPVYRRLAYVGRTVQDAAGACSQLVASVMYERVSKTAPFITAAAWALCVAVAYTCFLQARERLEGDEAGDLQAVFLKSPSQSTAVAAHYSEKGGAVTRAEGKGGVTRADSVRVVIHLEEKLRI
jgi:hypothetical protein